MRAMVPGPSHRPRPLGRASRRRPGSGPHRVDLHPEPARRARHRRQQVAQGRRDRGPHRPRAVDRTAHLHRVRARRPQGAAVGVGGGPRHHRQGAERGKAEGPAHLGLRRGQDAGVGRHRRHERGVAGLAGLDDHPPRGPVAGAGAGSRPGHEPSGPGQRGPAPARRPGTAGRAARSRTPRTPPRRRRARGAARPRCPPRPGRRRTRSASTSRRRAGPHTSATGDPARPRAPRAGATHPVATPSCGWHRTAHTTGRSSPQRRHRSTGPPAASATAPTRTTTGRLGDGRRRARARHRSVSHRASSPHAAHASSRTRRCG